MTSIEELASQAAALILKSRRLVVFTGAGVSTESGIPDFRGPDGIWTKLNPSDFTFQKFLSDPEARKNSWRRARTSPLAREDVLPNAAHLAIAELEKLGLLDCVVTQNVDGLHQKAGNSEERVIELHGTNRFAQCLDCGRRWPRAEILKRVDDGIEDPRCEFCGGIIKSATIAFGQPMPVRETAEAERRCRVCDLCLVIGSSLVVYPAAYMPVYALEAGAGLVIINDSETHLDRYAAVRIFHKAGPTMSLILGKVKEGLARRTI